MQNNVFAVSHVHLSLGGKVVNPMILCFPEKSDKRTDETHRILGICEHTKRWIGRGTDRIRRDDNERRSLSKGYASSHGEDTFSAV